MQIGDVVPRISNRESLALLQQASRAYKKRRPANGPDNDPSRKGYCRIPHPAFDGATLMLLRLP
jgi:hypothetical protein